MSETYTLPTGCGGLTIDSDGSRYAADRHGHIQVDNPGHVAEINRKGLRYIAKTGIGFGGMAGARCECGFLPHSWSRRCRCGRPISGVYDPASC